MNGDCSKVFSYSNPELRLKKLTSSNISHFTCWMAELKNRNVSKLNIRIGISPIEKVFTKNYMANAHLQSVSGWWKTELMSSASPSYVTNEKVEVHQHISCYRDAKSILSWILIKISSRYQGFHRILLASISLADVHDLSLGQYSEKG